MADFHNFLQVRRLYIDTYQEPVIYMRCDCHICRSEGFEAQSRIAARGRNATLVATLNVVSDALLASGQVGLSGAAW